MVYETAALLRGISRHRPPSDEQPFTREARERLIAATPRHDKSPPRRHDVRNAATVTTLTLRLHFRNRAVPLVGEAFRPPVYR
ncbi:hypothetical protein [Burkholderia ambifaria]|uniref:hypothetical protein n=1 Tax=Burkholderia ambifaria TaxID=152480 RepID=UPI00158B0AD3|nr:hypothetical protein [Burkholderia ambifaria]MBR8347785.1 hypothetical protein [Burkholderia ambifaria]